MSISSSSRRVVPREVEAAMGAEPTDEQWAAISMPLRPFVLVAGAGSGKTSVMAARVVYLALVALGRVSGTDAGNGVMPGNVLCLTFTIKATENLRQRVRHALSSIQLPEGEEPEILNYHGFAASMLERYGVLAGIEPGQRVLSAAQRNEICARVLDEMTFDFAAATYQPSLVAKILELDEQAANHLRKPDEIIEFNIMRLEQLAAHRSDRAYKSAQERIELAQAAARYRDLKRRLGVIDFSDQIDLALRVVTEHPEVIGEYRDRFHAVLLDEYQDTNVAQARLMQAVFGDGHPVTAVGDPDQNIYAWRGASLYNLLEFPQRFPDSDGKAAAKLPLYTNFRSGARILAAADTIIGPLPAAQRPDPEKALRPHPANGEGEVTVARHLDEWTEATWIAQRAVELHRSGSAWSDIAVLCRTSRLFQLLQGAFTEHGVPVEILGLAGLLKLPEVVEVLAYARAVQDPMASVALARILLGPRYRVGFKDLALVARLAKNKNIDFREMEGDDAESDPYLFAEALERLDDVADLSEEGRVRLQEFRDELRELRIEARKPVPEFLSEVIRRTGLLTEVDAEPDPHVAAATRRNLSSFLDQVHGFEPIEGELTLRAFLDYLDEADRLDKQEWAPVQPSDEDSVKVMTIHVAKGLEFDHVFVPGVAHGLLPNPQVPQNPAERGKSMDFELRGDSAILPTYDGNLSRFKEQLHDQEIIEERRTAYVALTRARRSLWVSGAFWYADNIKPKGSSMFFEELAEWGSGSGLAHVEAGPAEAGLANPMLGLRARFVRPWPGPAMPVDDDELFKNGWRMAAVEASTAGGVQASLVESLSDTEKEAFHRGAADTRQVATHLREREAAEAAEVAPVTPRSISASGMIDYARCPKRYYWTNVRPLPRFSGPAARIGTEIHAWIERRAEGQPSLLELDDAPDLTIEELAGEPGKTDRLKENFLSSRFAELTPLFSERAFLLRMDQHTVAGRIDAIFGTDMEGPWEIVDWKTGRKPQGDPLSGLQLDVYGLACLEIWRKDPADLTLTYAYLASGEEVSQPMGDPAEVRARLTSTLTAIASGEFEPAPGTQCVHCDFRAFCDAGTRWLAANS
jgi:DNA helicase II / ATP-dependent DNA helicase PcrA